jgi:hypothetical protein
MKTSGATNSLSREKRATIQALDSGEVFSAFIDIIYVHLPLSSLPFKARSLVEIGLPDGISGISLGRSSRRCDEAIAHSFDTVSERLN